jgi:hypothetical protein
MLHAEQLARNASTLIEVIGIVEVAGAGACMENNQI